MRPLTALLAASTLTFALSTLYFAREATRQRIHNDFAGAAFRAPVRDVEESRRTTSGNFGGSDAESAAGPGQEIRPDLRSDARNWMAARVEELSDPESRRRAIEARARMYRETQFRGADRYLGIQRDEFHRLLHSMAEIMTERERRIFACDIAPDCDGIAERRVVNAAHPLAGALPAEQVEVLNGYGQSQSERSAVERWRAGLAPALAPSIDDGVRLALRLGNARQQFEREALQRGEKVLHLSGGLVSAAAPGSAQEHAARLASVRLHARRMYDVASTQLTSEQLGTFSAALDKAVTDSEARLQERAVAAAARGASADQLAR